MMRTDIRGRSASPHRITYKSDFHAIKCSFDTGACLQSGTKTVAATQRSAVHPNRLLSCLSDPIMSHTSRSSSADSRGRIQSTRGTKIRDNIFLQMDSQQSRQDSVPALSSCSTPLPPPSNLSLQLQTSPFPRSKRSVISSSSVMSTLTSISTREMSLQEKPSRTEGKVDIDRAALAQKFSVTRRLFEAKMTEGGGQVSKAVIDRGSKGAADGREEVEKGEEASGEKKQAEEDGLDKDKSINHMINISLLKPQAATRCPKSPALDGPRETPNKSPSSHDIHDKTSVSQTEEDGGEKATPHPCSAPEATLRAELVSIKNESSESDENEAERVSKENKQWLKDDMEKHTHKAAEECEEALEDDVFEEPTVETTSAPVYLLGNGVDFKGVEDGPITSTDHQKELTEDMQWKRVTQGGGERSGDKYQQVNEQWEGKKEEQNRQFTAQTEKKSTEEKDGGEKKTDTGLGEVERVVMQDEGKAEGEEEDSSQSQWKGGKEERGVGEEGTTSELNEEPVSEAVKRAACRIGNDGKDDVGGGKDDQTGAAVICGIENKAFVYDQDSQSNPELSASLRQESCLHRENPLVFEEIPGVPELDFQDDKDAPEVVKRKVSFSMAPIKVKMSVKEKKNIYIYLHFTFARPLVPAAVLKLAQSHVSYP